MIEPTMTPAEWAAAALKQAETAGVPVALVRIEHLRELLDELARPCSHTWNGKIDTSEGGVTLHLDGFSGPGKLLAAAGRGRDLAADLTDAIDQAQSEAEMRAEGWSA